MKGWPSTIPYKTGCNKETETKSHCELNQKGGGEGTPGSQRGQRLIKPASGPARSEVSAQREGKAGNHNNLTQLKGTKAASDQRSAHASLAKSLSNLSL